MPGRPAFSKLMKNLWTPATKSLAGDIGTSAAMGAGANIAANMTTQDGAPSWLAPAAAGASFLARRKLPGARRMTSALVPGSLTAFAVDRGMRHNLGFSALDQTSMRNQLNKTLTERSKQVGQGLLDKYFQSRDVSTMSDQELRANMELYRRITTMLSQAGGQRV